MHNYQTSAVLPKDYLSYTVKDIPKRWWHDKIAYQIYPRSFFDANGDGTGDVKGITQKLDYIKDLGIDVVWISPFYKSPMDDGGYDISDYYDVDPIFGKKEDALELIQEANKRGIKLLFDLVLNHCSDEHEWFQKALADPNCEEADYFYFRTTEDGCTCKKTEESSTSTDAEGSPVANCACGTHPPNNWRSMFGGSAWEQVEDGRWYMHLFSKKQPDLNWENPKLREKLYEMVNYWLDQGLGGFRIDAITHIKKEATLSSLPPDGPDGMVDCYVPTRNYPGIGDFLLDMRKNTFDKYECLTVAEAAGVPYHELVDYIGADGYFDTLFDFSYSELYHHGHTWYTCKRAGEWPIVWLRDKMFASQIETAKIGMGAVYFENHDYPRASAKFIPEEHRGLIADKMLGTCFFFLRGIPFIYQGQELGMTNVRMDSINDYDDISTKNHYNLAIKDGLTPEQAIDGVATYSRDNARVPFSWDDSIHGGFGTDADKQPWLKVHPKYKEINAKAAIADPNSVYHHYKAMIALRKDERYKNTFTNGNITPIMLENEQIIAYERSYNGQTLAVICNFSHEAQTVTLPWAPKQLLLDNVGQFMSGDADDKVVLAPHQAVVLEV